MKAKRLPRLWCAMQGLLPIEACQWVQMGELAWPRDAQETVPEESSSRNGETRGERRKHVAARKGTVNVGRRGPV